MSAEKPVLPELGSLPHMVVWYGPAALYKTGQRAFISSLFGHYADQRILQWVTDKVPSAELVQRYDFSDLVGPGENRAVWTDYVADAGDGFDSSFAIASLIARPSLEIEGAGTLEGGKILIMGGDQVYPYPSPGQYDVRLVTPYSLADTETVTPDRTVFMLPGNHDWYDGLASFDQMFCRARTGVSEALQIGPWRCAQHRSYFAVKLPHDWWIWGVDTQLAGDLDAGQIQYFQAITRSIADPQKTKIILCVPEPVWHHGPSVGSESGAAQGNVERIASIASNAGKVCAILTGDLHHYSRYCSTETGLNLITAGGGGAYLSPTHHLPESIDIPWKGAVHPFSLCEDVVPEPGQASEKADPSLFPSRMESKALSWRLLLFPFYNRAFSFLGLGIIYWMMTWLYSSAPLSPGDESGRGSGYLRSNASCDAVFSIGDVNVGESMRLILDTAGRQPLLALFGVIAMFGFYCYVPSRRTSVRLMVGLPHWAVHVAVMGLLVTLFSQVNRQFECTMPQVFMTPWGMAMTNSVLLPLEMIVFGGFAAGVVWGAYLFLTCRLFKIHMDDAFSALRLDSYKHFLRMRIEPDQLTIYPIGLRRTPHRIGWRKRTPEERDAGERAAFVPRTPFEPRLIEKPIVIRPSTMKEL